MNGGCAGNAFVPAVEQDSQIIVYPGDRFFNSVEEMCLEKVVEFSNFRALKIPFRVGSDCEGNEDSEKCRAIETVQRPVETWGRLETTFECYEVEGRPTQYFLKFTPSYSGFYSIDIPAGPPSILPINLGPLVIPVEAAAVDPAKTIAWGEGIFGVVQSELATFTIQPIDTFGNHHTNGVHVFQVVISQIEPLTAFRLVVDPVDTGLGTATVEYQLQTPAIYGLEVRYCKDLLRYPPYIATENRFCDLGTVDLQGPYIKSAPFRVTIVPYQFFIPIINVPGMMTQFRFGDVGERYYALFTANFPVCGETYGTPSVRCTICCVCVTVLNRFFLCWLCKVHGLTRWFVQRALQSGGSIRPCRHDLYVNPTRPRSWAGRCACKGCHIRTVCINTLFCICRQVYGWRLCFHVHAHCERILQSVDLFRH